MNSFKQCILLTLSLLILGTVVTPVMAYERDDHDKYMCEVLFKNFKEIDNDLEIQDDLNALECASYLAIDQFNSNGQKDLDTLHAYGVKDIPKSITELAFTASGKTHREKTHRGWDFSYTGEMLTKWPLRKKILLNTCDAIFDFNENEAQKESFCKLIYYIHILGDHMDDKSYKVQNGLKIDVGGRKDDYDIIHELLNSFEILFKDQIHTHKYQSLTASLLKINAKLKKIVRSEGGINTDEKFKLKQQYVTDLMKVLTLYVPEMLKEESFFYDVFYQH